MTDETRAAIAERMNRLDATGVVWDRCILLPSSGAAYGWIARDDGRSDFVVLEFSWGTTRDLADVEVAWLATGFTTSSAAHSAHISELILGSREHHTDCERVEDVFGALVNRKVEVTA